MRIYHITHFDNLPSIINLDRLIAYNQLKQQKVGYRDIAYEQIQDRRSKIIVPCGKKGVLHDYVPFYFSPRSPMLYAINKGKVQGYQEGQNHIIHLVVDIETIANSNLAFTFTDGHPIMAYSQFYDDINLLDDVIDWELMQAKYWNDTEEDPNRKCRRQAEFLVHQCCPWRFVKEIGVINNDIKIKVEKILPNQSHQPPVKIDRNCYY